MKKRIYLLLLSVFVLFSSCRDKSNEFIEQLFTNEQISIALRQCITVAGDSTLNALCIVDSLQRVRGFNYYESGAYKIELPVAAAAMIDTLIQYNITDKEEMDVFIFKINNAAERCGNHIKIKFLNPVSSLITFPNPNAVLQGGNTAITNFVKSTRQSEFVSLLVFDILKEQFNADSIITTWNFLQEEYYKKTEIYSSIDILNDASQQLVTQFFKKMASVEDAIRKNPALRGNKEELLFKVFATL
jgi:hypothetical protein